MHRINPKHSLNPSVASIGELVNTDIIFDEYNSPYLNTEDRFSKLRTIAMLKTNSGSEILTALTNVASIYEKRTFKIKQILSENEVVFQYTSYPMAKNGIFMLRTASGEHNKIIERSVRTLKEKVNTLKASLVYKLPKNLEQYVFEYAVFLLNRQPNAETFPTTPWELFTADKFNVRDTPLLPFGTVAVWFLDESLRSKVHSSRGRHGIYVGKEPNVPKGMKVYVPARDEIVIRPANYSEIRNPLEEWQFEANPIRNSKLPGPRTRNVIDPSDRLAHDHRPVDQLDDGGQVEDVGDHEEAIGDATEALIASETEIIAEEVSSEVTFTSGNSNQEPEVAQILEVCVDQPTLSSDEGGKKSRRQGIAKEYGLRPRTIRQAFKTSLEWSTSIVDYLWNYDSDSQIDETESISKSYRTYVKQALSKDNPYRELSGDAIRKELQQMVTLDVFSPVKFEDIPSKHRAKIISSLMFIKEKRKMDGTIDKIKARLAARGDQAPIGLDQLFSSPTANLITVYTVLSIAVKYGCDIRTMDVPGAYLHAPLPAGDVVYMSIPNDCEDIYCNIVGVKKEELMHSNGKIYVKLKKALYGLRQSSKLWYEVL
jgi:hypothetical protein